MVRAHTGARTEMTEVCCSTGSGYARGYNPGMRAGLWLADTVWRDLSAGDVSSFSWWTALSPQLGCTPASDPTCAAASNAAGWNDGLLYYDPDFRIRRQPVDLLHPPLLGARELQPLHPPRRRALPRHGRPRPRPRDRVPAQHLALRPDQRRGGAAHRARAAAPARQPPLRHAVGLYDVGHRRPRAGGRTADAEPLDAAC